MIVVQQRLLPPLLLQHLGRPQLATASSPTGNTSSSFANGKIDLSPSTWKTSHDQKLVQDLVEDISLDLRHPRKPPLELFRRGQAHRPGDRVRRVGLELRPPVPERLQRRISQAVRRPSKDSPELLGILRNLKTKLAKDTYQESRVWDALCDNTRSIKKAFALFDKKFNPARRRTTAIEAEMAELKKDILRNISTDIDRNIFLAVCLFIETTLRTNFYIREKTSLTYMYDPKFLNKVDYPETPFGIFHVVGAEFRGFHIRFRDIARGGIRIVKSPNLQTYLNNSDFIFDENYNLAWTQQRKNKDLPEGGSKGTILLNWGYMDKARACFKKYVDGLLDLILPSEVVVDYYGKPVILFLGPDEGNGRPHGMGGPAGQAARLCVLEGLLDGKAGRRWAASPTTSTA